MKNYAKEKIGKIEKEKSDRKKTKATWIGDESVKVFKKLYGKKHKEQVIELTDYLNKNFDRKFRPNTDILINDESQISFRVDIYEGKENDSKLYQELSLEVFKMPPDFYDDKELRKKAKEDPGYITLAFLNKDQNGNILKKFEVYNGDVVHEMDDRTEQKFTIDKKEEAFKSFINYLGIFADMGKEL